MRLARIMILAAMLLAAPSARAGGPIDYTDAGEPLKWPSDGREISVALDRGNLGALDNSDADALTSGALRIWNDVAHSSANIAIARDELATDVTHLNYVSLWGRNGFTPVIYDIDGQIIENWFGVGASSRVLGYTGIKSENATIVEGLMVLNGLFLDGVSSGPANREISASEFEGVIVHEFGHLLGLDHAQINALDDTNDDQPTMFPFFQGGEAMGSLAPDDIGWISYLYPEDSFTSAFGAIAGEIIHEPSWIRVGYQGLNVIARRINGGRIDAGSCVSGYLYRADVGAASRKGQYVIPGLIPGPYKVEIEEILGLFTGGSSVGPLSPPAKFPAPAGREFYNAPFESAYDNPADFAAINVEAGQWASKIDIVLNTQEMQLDTRVWMLYH